MKTPTAVAEFLVSGIYRFYEKLLDIEHVVVQFARNVIETEQSRLERIAESISYSVSDYINERQIQLTRKGNEIQQNVSQFVFKKSNEINNLKYGFESVVSLWFVETKNRLVQKQRILKRVTDASILRENNHIIRLKEQTKNSLRRVFLMERERIHLNENTIRLLNPENVLKRGYTLTFKEGKIIKSAKQLTLNEEVEIKFSDGKVKSRIIKKDKNGN
jgi:exodeoxyribonuclease VII large subunit